jgi:uncharacterized protein (DUF2267 family)
MRAILATLETLGERLHGNEAADLAAQLTPAIGAYLRLGHGPETFSLAEFFARVTRREGVDSPDAVYHARVVLEVLQEAVSAGEIADVQAQLPADWAPLFAGAAGRLRPAS